MSRSGMWGVGVAVLVALAGSARADDWPDQRGLAAGSSGGWFARWFGSAEPKPAARKAEPKKEKEKADKADKTRAEPPSPLDQAAALRERELQALMRRQMVCLKLMRIAQETADEALLRKAEQLDAQAQRVYDQRTAHLPISRVSFESDENTLEKHLGRDQAEAALNAPREPAGTSGRVERNSSLTREEQE